MNLFRMQRPISLSFLWQLDTMCNICVRVAEFGILRNMFMFRGFNFVLQWTRKIYWLVLLLGFALFYYTFRSDAQFLISDFPLSEKVSHRTVYEISCNVVFCHPPIIARTFRNKKVRNHFDIPIGLRIVEWRAFELFFCFIGFNFCFDKKRCQNRCLFLCLTYKSVYC